MNQYLELMKQVLEEGEDGVDRTGVGTRSIFGAKMTFNLHDGFPAVTTKKLAWKAVLSELLWFIEGSGDERRLCEILHGTRDSSKKTIWSGNATSGYWADKAKFPGDLGVVYGSQWRRWKKYVEAYDDGYYSAERGHTSYAVRYEVQHIDQIAQLIDNLINDPKGRRHILSAWNPAEFDNMALPPCHILAQFYVSKLSNKEINTTYLAKRSTLSMEDRKIFDIDSTGQTREGRAKTVQDLKEVGLPTHKLSCQMYQRSGDLALGVPFNIASYSLLTHMLAQVCGYEVGQFIHIIGDCHIYNDHIEGVIEQLTRSPLALPSLNINKAIVKLEDFTMNDFELVGYQHYPSIKLNMAV